MIQLYVLLLIIAELAMANVLGPYAEWTLSTVLRFSIIGVLAYGAYGVQGVLRAKRDRKDSEDKNLTIQTPKPTATWSQL